MKAIYKLNDTLGYSTQINNRNVVAAICAQEFNLILKYTPIYSELKLLEDLIQTCLREVHSDVPMKLFQLDELLNNYSTYPRKTSKPSVNINGGGNVNVNVDLSNYYTISQINELLSKKQDELIAGENVDIDGNVISIDLSDVEGGGFTAIHNEYGDSTIGAISQKFFTQEVKANTEDINVLEDDMDTLEGDMDALEVNVDTLGGDISKLEGNVNTLEGNVTSMEDTIAMLQAAVFPFTIKSFTGGGTYEKGSSQTVTLNWQYDRDVTSQSINGTTLGVAVRSKTYTNVTTDTTYTLTATSGGQTVSNKVTAKFSLKKYWGTSSKTSLTNNEILSLSSGWAQRTMGSTTFDCTGGKYPYYILPSSMTSGIEFWINGLQNTDWNTEEISLTNTSGHTEKYTIFRLNTIQTGVLKIEVK